MLLGMILDIGMYCCASINITLPYLITLSVLDEEEVESDKSE